MRLSDLLGAEVRDQNERPLGVVADVRLVQDGPILGTFGAAFRVHGLVIGPRRFGAHLGFDRANVRGPLLLTWFFGLVQRPLTYATWTMVRSVEEHLVRVEVPPDGLEPAGAAR
jgi:hypothetical protein